MAHCPSNSSLTCSFLPSHSPLLKIQVTEACPLPTFICQPEMMGKVCPFPFGKQYWPLAATRSVPFAGLQVGLARVLALGRKNIPPFIPPSIPAPLCCAPRDSCDLRMKHLFFTAQKDHVSKVSLSTQNKNEQNDHVTAWYCQPAGMFTRISFAQDRVLEFLLEELFHSCDTRINNRQRWRSQFYNNDAICSSHSKLFCKRKILLTRHCCLTLSTANQVLWAAKAGKLCVQNLQTLLKWSFGTLSFKLKQRDLLLLNDIISAHRAQADRYLLLSLELPADLYIVSSP